MLMIFRTRMLFLSQIHENSQFFRLRREGVLPLVVEAVEQSAAGAASLCESFVVQESLLLDISQVLRQEWQQLARAYPRAALFCQVRVSFISLAFSSDNL